MQMISSPARAWEEIRLEEDRRKVFTAFCLSYDWFMRAVGLYRFFDSERVGVVRKSFQYAMTQCCAVAVSLFGGYFLAAYLINGLRVRMFVMDNDIPFDATVCRLCAGSAFFAENYYRYIA